MEKFSLYVSERTILSVYQVYHFKSFMTSWTNEWIGVILPDFWFSLLEKIRITITILFTLLIMWTMRRNISANNMFWAQIHNQSLAVVF